ncbi:MAG TPA: hypothetical protein VKR38_12360 [Usitatibacter sp.]|nr:hypothetical protein [Usitatibacter sp.]
MKTRHLLVYRYKFWDTVSNEARVSDTYSTFDAIVKGLGVPILDTAIVVPNTGNVQSLLALQDSLCR